MAAGPYLLGIDVGTESVRAGIFDAAGTPLGWGTAPYPVHFPQPGWAEQEAEDWWAACGVASRAALAEAGVPPEAVVALGLDGTSCTPVWIDAAGRLLRRPILWMDVRAADQARRIAACGDPALAYNGYGNVSAEWMPCKALWVKEHQPEVHRAAATVFEAGDWLVYRFTGERTANINTVSTRWYYNRARGGWPVSFYQVIGLADLLEKFPARVLDLGVPVGGLRPEAAELLGLRPGTLVARGGSDAYIGMIGLDVVAPGRLALITGSSHLHLALHPTGFHARGLFGAFPDAVVPGLHLVEGGQISTGSVVRWFREQFAAGRSYTELDAAAAALPPGSEGLVALEYWQGNRTPHTDPEARGAIWGFTLRHTSAHVYRALLEAVAYGTEAILRSFAAAGVQPREVVACGGATRSPLWLRIHADVSNVPIRLTAVGDAPVLGSVILAAVAAGLYPSIPAASAAMVRFTETIEPDPAAHKQYAFYFERYQETYPALRDLMHRTARHVAGGS